MRRWRGRVVAPGVSVFLGIRGGRLMRRCRMLCRDALQIERCALDPDPGMRMHARTAERMYTSYLEERAPSKVCDKL